MTGHLSIEILGVLKGAAEGPLAISALAFIALAFIIGVWFSKRRAD